MSYSTVSTSIPASLACFSVDPTEATCGSVKVTCGTLPASAMSVNRDPVGGRPSARAAMTAPQIRAWYLPMWVSSARPVMSPTAYSHSPGTPWTAS